MTLVPRIEPSQPRRKRGFFVLSFFSHDTRRPERGRASDRRSISDERI
jgi:hypothetical protein